MINRRRSVIVAGAVVVLAATAWVTTRHLGVADAPVAGTPVAAFSPASELEQRNREIALFQERIQEDPSSAADYAWLASLYLLRARETANDVDYRRAEEAARTSLSLRTAHNVKTFRVLAASLLDQHRFAEALEAAQTLVNAEPENPLYRALLGEIQLEVGDYEGARITFGSLERDRQNPAVAPPLARWAEIQGRTDEARSLLYAARDAAAARTDLSSEQAAWYHFRVGDFELQHGRVREAEEAFRAGLAIRSGDHRILAGMARLEIARQNWEKAIEYGERMGDAIDLATLTLIGDAHAALGDGAAAERYYQMLEADAAESPEPYNRQLYQFRLDHDRRVPETLAILRKEIEERKDVLGYDLLAWALYRAGDYAAAKDAMTQALRMGTQDASFYFHAGLIEQALGDEKAARRHFKKALEINPHFHPTQAALARAALRGR
jgi:tetratricopeptide (TPR) repeat protein